jgi:hypothetical protein
MMIIRTRTHRCEITVDGANMASILASWAIHTSRWVEVMPLPDDRYRVVMRDENAEAFAAIYSKFRTPEGRVPGTVQ